MQNQPAIVIPAYRPTEFLIKFLKDLLERDSQQVIIVVDDGSGPEYKAIFQSVTELPLILLEHKENLGKGAALKTAFQYWLNSPKNTSKLGVVTADADGQHAIDDISRMKDALMEAPDDFIIGTREFSSKKIPFRSRFGNNITRLIFKYLLRIKVDDTQSGLRAIPFDLMQKTLIISTNHYEFELEMILLANKNNTRIKQLPIQTIYIDDNKSSHFNPIIDSIKIYYVFFRFAGVSMLSALIDFVIFSIIFSLTHKILYGIIFGRLISASLNFILNKRVTFQDENKWHASLVGYCLLAVSLATLSYFGIHLLYFWGVNVYLGKVLVESALYVFSFMAQKHIIFNKKR